MIQKFKYILIWIKELFRFCPARKKNINREQIFLVCGHRGSPVKEPENTIPSFEKALTENVNSLEIDLCVTKDREVVLWHDWNPNEFVALIRESGFEPAVGFKPDFPPLFSEMRKNISELELDEFRNNYNLVNKDNSEPANAHILTIEEFIEWVADKERIKYVYLDIKVPDDEKDLFLVILDQLDEFKKKYLPKCKFIIETFSKEVLEVGKSKYPDLLYCLDVEIPPGFIFIPRKYSSVKVAVMNNNSIALVLKPRKITIANWITYRRVIRFDVRKKKRYNKKSSKKIDFLFGCTINDEKEMECLIKKGINGMQTDYPEMLANLAKQYELQVS